MDILELLKVLAVSFIEGITEWLPVSSTGHMLLFDEFFKLNFSNEFNGGCGYILVATKPLRKT